MGLRGLGPAAEGVGSRISHRKGADKVRSKQAVKWIIGITLLVLLGLALAGIHSGLVATPSTAGSDNGRGLADRGSYFQEVNDSDPDLVLDGLELGRSGVRPNYHRPGHDYPRRGQFHGALYPPGGQGRLGQLPHQRRSYLLPHLVGRRLPRLARCSLATRSSRPSVNASLAKTAPVRTEATPVTHRV